MRHVLARLAVLALLAPTAVLAAPPGWSVVKDKSRIAFSGTHAGKPFTGTFGEWSAEIAFDPSDLAASKVTVRVDPASAKTGTQLYDSTLPQTDWFDVKAHPAAAFESTAIARQGDGYKVEGTLTLRGQAKPVSLDMTLDINGATATANLKGSVDRLAYGIGAKPDPSASWVAKDIGLDITVVATR